MTGFRRAPCPFCLRGDVQVDTGGFFRLHNINGESGKGCPMSGGVSTLPDVRQPRYLGHAERRALIATRAKALAVRT